MQASPPVVPGIYPGGGQASLLRTNEQQWLFQNQAAPTPPYASIAVQLERIKSAFSQFGASFQIFFTNANGSLVPANPGTFEIDIQTSDTDANDASYVTIDTINSGLNASYVTRLELASFWAKYVRAKIVTLTNPVNVNVLVTR